MFDCDTKFIVSHNHARSYSVNAHEHPCYEIVYYKKGRGTTVIGGKKYHFEDDTFTIIEPGLMHSEVGSGPVDLIYVGFMINNDFVRLPTGLYSGKDIDILADMLQAQQEMDERKSFYDRMLNNITERIVVKIKRKLSQSANHTDDVFERAEGYIKQNCMKNIRVTELAKLFGYNYDYFRNAFKEKYGISIKTYISNQRLIYAEDLLRNSDWSIKKIAASSGYNSSSHFGLEFKKAVGMTPKEYRRQSESGEIHKEVAVFK